MLTAHVVVTSPGNPPIVGSISFYDGTTLLGTEPVSNGVAILNAGSLSPGSHSFSTVFSGGGTSSGSASSLIVSADGPQVTGLRRYGFHWQPTYLLISNYPKTLSSPGFYGGYTPFSDSYSTSTAHLTRPRLRTRRIIRSLGQAATGSRSSRPSTTRRPRP